MRVLANAAFPLLSEFAASHSPGERLGAVSLLQSFASVKHLPFLVDLIHSEKPFVGYQAALAMEFAVSATEPRCYPELRKAIDDAIAALAAAPPGGDVERELTLARARARLQDAMGTVTLPPQPLDA
jgi:hypothetical protein